MAKVVETFEENLARNEQEMFEHPTRNEIQGPIVDELLDRVEEMKNLQIRYESEAMWVEHEAKQDTEPTDIATNSQQSGRGTIIIFDRPKLLERRALRNNYK